MTDSTWKKHAQIWEESTYFGMCRICRKDFGPEECELEIEAALESHYEMHHLGHEAVCARCHSTMNCRYEADDCPGVDGVHYCPACFHPCSQKCPICGKYCVYLTEGHHAAHNCPHNHFWNTRDDAEAAWSGPVQPPVDTPDQWVRAP